MISLGYVQPLLSERKADLQRMQNHAESHYRDQLTSKNRSLLKIYQYLDKILWCWQDPVSISTLISYMF